MKYHCASRIVAVALMSALPVLAHSAESEAIEAFSGGSTADQLDLEAVSERIRETGAQMRADLKKARARLEAQKARQESERKREAEQARQQAVKDAAAQAAIRDNKQRQVVETPARREAGQRTQVSSQVTSPAQRAKDEKEARERAAKALMEARQSAGPKAMED